MLEQFLAKQLVTACRDSAYQRPDIFVVLDDLGVRRDVTAQVCGVAGPTVSQWARGKCAIPARHVPTLLTLARVAHDTAVTVLGQASADPAKTPVMESAVQVYSKRVAQAGQKLRELERGDA